MVRELSCLACLLWPAILAVSLISSCIQFPKILGLLFEPIRDYCFASVTKRRVAKVVHQSASRSHNFRVVSLFSGDLSAIGELLAYTLRQSPRHRHESLPFIANGSQCYCSLPYAPVVLEKRLRMFEDYDIATTGGDCIGVGVGPDGFAGVCYLSGRWHRHLIPQQLGIVQGGWILGVALKNVLKLFEGIIKLFLFV